MARDIVDDIDITDEEVTLNTNTTGEFSEIIDIQVPKGYRYEFVKGHPITMFIYTHESFTVSASSTETKNLSNDLVNSPVMRDIETSSAETQIYGPRSLVVWDDEDDIQTGVDSVDYSADSFAYTDSDANANPLEVFYLFGDSSSVQFREYQPDEETFDVRYSDNIRAFHTTNVYDSTQMIQFGSTFTLEEKQHLKVAINTDVDLTNWDVYDENQGGGPGTMTTYSYSNFSIPVRKVQV